MDIITRHPLFAALPSEAQYQLSGLFTSCAFSSGDVIVKENDIVDSIYFIIRGRAEVRKEVMMNDEMNSQPIAILKDNESIGLNESGIFSPFGNCYTTKYTTK